MASVVRSARYATPVGRDRSARYDPRPSEYRPVDPGTFCHDRAHYPDNASARDGISAFQVQGDATHGRSLSELIESEIKGVRELWEKKLIPIQRVTALERDLVRIRGERGALTSEVAQTRGRISETQLQLIQLDQDLRTKVGQELSETWNRVAELVERKVSAQDQLNRVEIRAPQDGIVDGLSVHTVGGVIAAGETLMRVVPAEDRLTVEARLPPQERDQTHPGQRAILRFSALNQRTTPEIEGSVAMISADVTTDPKTGQVYYTTRVSVPEEQLARLGEVKVSPGMPVEVFVQTQARTVLSYVTKPFADQIARAFREK